MSSPAPESTPVSKAGGPKVLGMPRQTVIIFGVALAVAVGYFLWKRRGASAAAANPNAQKGMSGECTDANGNPTPCVDMAGVDYAGQLSVIQTELESIAAGQGSAASPPATAPTGTTAPPPAATQVQQYPMVPFTAKKLNSNTIQVTFSALTSPTPAPGSYTIEAWQLNGKVAAQQTITAPDTTGGKGSATINGLHPAWCYNVRVWANGGKAAPSGTTEKVCL